MLAGVLIRAGLSTSWDSATWMDYLSFAAVFSVFLGVGAFFLHLVYTQAIVISNTTLMVRETFIPLEDIVGCRVIDPPKEARVDWLQYRRETLTRLYLVVPYKVDRLVEVTRASGKAVVFSAEEPDAVCAALKQKCKNLA